jgi:hypothetical protein
MTLKGDESEVWSPRHVGLLSALAPIGASCGKAAMVDKEFASAACSLD